MGRMVAQLLFFTPVFAPSALRPCVCIAAVRMYCCRAYVLLMICSPSDTPELQPDIPQISLSRHLEIGGGSFKRYPVDFLVFYHFIDF